MAIEHFVAQRRKAAVDPSTAKGKILGQGTLVAPDGAPGASVQSEGAVLLPGQVHDAVNDQRGSLKMAGRSGLKDPPYGQVLYVAGVNLFQQVVALTAVVAGVGEPVVRLIGCFQQPLVADLRPNANGARASKPQAEEERVCFQTVFPSKFLAPISPSSLVAHPQRNLSR